MSPLDYFLSAPPVSRTLAAVTFTLSLLIITGVLRYDLFNLSLAPIIQLPPQIWRIFTSLAIVGSRLGIIYDTYFIYVYGSKLEISSPRFVQRADFVTYVCFVSGVIVLINLFIISGGALAPALGLAFVTSTTRDIWDQPITFIVLKMPAQYLPYAMLLLTVILLPPQSAAVQATGLVAAHFYDLCSGLYPSFGIKRNLITTPGWIKRMFGTQGVVERSYGVVVVNGGATEAAWGLDLSWQKFGPGRTLGGGGTSTENQRPTGLALAAMVMGAFVVLCLVLGYLFMLYGGHDMKLLGVDIGRLLGKPDASKNT